jgi:hypothetical protein
MLYSCIVSSARAMPSLVHALARRVAGGGPADTPRPADSGPPPAGGGADSEPAMHMDLSAAAAAAAAAAAGRPAVGRDGVRRYPAWEGAPRAGGGPVPAAGERTWERVARPEALAAAAGCVGQYVCVWVCP